ncbi:MAG: hypothetical protein GY874_10960 [Desulfobacteraceae bacterium]|nr:hypothetical protein [Desulfobacteraceae bacterium]
MKKIKVAKLVIGLLFIALGVLINVEDGINYAFATDSINLSPRSELNGLTNTNIYKLIQDRYSDTISFPDFIRQIKSNPEIQDFIQELLTLLTQRYGIEIDSSIIEASLDQPELILDQLQFTTEQLNFFRKIAAELFLLASENSINEDLLPSMLKCEYQLPQLFDYNDIDATMIELPPSEPEQVIQDVYVGFKRDPKLPEEKLRANIIFGEVIERLSINLLTDETQKFTVVYNGISYQRLNEFINALLSSGHELSAFVRHYVAPFIPLYAKGPDAILHPVASTVFQRTGLTDESGKEAIFPLLHSEITFFIKPEPQIEGQAISASIQFYQGIPKMGFYGNGCIDIAAWVGETISDVFSPQEAVDALILAGYFTDINDSITKKQNLLFDGYAITGVCNDAVAVVHKAIRGESTSYPLFMDDEAVLPEINNRLSGTSELPDEQFDFRIYQIIRNAVETTPSDITLPDCANKRIIQSFPWQAGTEPFYSAVDARRILMDN